MHCISYYMIQDSNIDRNKNKNSIQPLTVWNEKIGLCSDQPWSFLTLTYSSYADSGSKGLMVYVQIGDL